MALVPGSEIRVAFRYQYLGQNCQNVQSYIGQGAAIIAVSMVQILEALWNDYKTRFLAIVPDDPSVAQMISLFGQEVGGSLEFGEYPIPLIEQVGTRSGGSGLNWLTGTVAVGFRQTVGSRFTRPGQKRFPFLLRDDVLGNDLGAGVLSGVADVADAFCSPSALGAPAAAIVLQPIVVHEPGVRDPVRRVQDVLGYVLNTGVTSQVSRKRGHGS